MESEELRRFDLLPKEMKVYCVASMDGWHNPMDYMLSKSWATMMHEHLAKAGRYPLLIQREVKKEQVFAYMRVSELDIAIVMDPEWIENTSDYVMQKNFPQS
ncbi:MAG: hypothetical protein EB059_10555 [Alphaproteobacteria bacterium]|nr:hypothetical protein [Alphaproteobacteria bacterium]